MNSIPNKIVDFLKNNRVATICFIDEKNTPYCFSCFFVFKEETAILVFKSSQGTSHEKNTKAATKISGTILPEQLDFLKIKGVQFSGKTLNENEIDSTLSSSYYKKYPFGRLMGGYIWAVKLEFIKFTDNTLTFGHKTLWSANPLVVI